jgi:hypothetical protein
MIRDALFYFGAHFEGPYYLQVKEKFIKLMKLRNKVLEVAIT